MSEIFAEIELGEIEKISNFGKDFSDLFKQTKKKKFKKEKIKNGMQRKEPNADGKK